ncbi:hypothetical protein vseg_005417 [Gypsophila vaccaria]
MSSIETLIVQIFDRKRQIIDQLKHHKQLYDQHLVSKLLIQGISPPPWLLPLDFPPYSSHFSALDKAGLISGLLHPRPGPAISCPASQGYLYDKAVSAVDTYGADEVCAGNYVSSAGCDEDSSSIIPPHHVDETEDRAGSLLQSHVKDNACELSRAPMSPEKKSCTSTHDAHPNQEQSLVKIQRSRSRQRALEIRKSAKTSGKSRLGISNNVSAPSQSKSCQDDEQFDAPRESPELVRPFSLSSATCYKEDASRGVKSPLDSGCLLTQFTEGDITEERTGDSLNKEKNSSIYVGRITRSRSLGGQSKSASSGSKALEYVAPLDGSIKLTESDKAFALPAGISSWDEEIKTCSVERSPDAPEISQSRNLTINNSVAGTSANKSRLGISNNVSAPSQSKSCPDEEQLDAPRESPELVRPFSLSSTSCYKEEASKEDANNKAEDYESSPQAGKISASSIMSPVILNHVSAPSQNKSCQDDEQLDAPRESPEPVRPFSLSSATCYKEDASKEDANNKAKDCDSSPQGGKILAFSIMSPVVLNHVSAPSESKSCQDDEQLDAPRESPQLVRRFSFSSASCYKEDASKEDANNKAKDCESSPQAGKILAFSIMSPVVLNHVSSPSQSKSGQYEQLDAPRESPELARPLSLSSTTCYKEDASKEDANKKAKDCESSPQAGKISAFSIISPVALSHVSAPSQSKSCQDDDQLDAPRESPECVRPFSFSSATCYKEDASNAVRSPIDSRCLLTQFSNNVVAEVDTGDNLKKEMNSSIYVGRFTRSRSLCRQSKSASSGSKALEYVAQLDGSAELTKSDKAFALTDWDEGIRNCSVERSADAPEIPQSRNLTINSSDASPSANKNCKGDKVNGLRESLQLVKPISTPTDIYNNEEVSMKARSPDYCADKLIQSAHHEAKVEHEEENCESEKSDSIYVGRMTSSSGFCQQSGGVSSESNRQDYSDCYLEKLEVETERNVSELCGASTTGGMVNVQYVVDSSSGPLPGNNKAKDCKNSPQPWKKSAFSIVSPVIDRMDVDEADLAMPDFESFRAQNSGDRFLFEENPLLSSLMEHSSLPEHISSSACFSASVSPLPAACKSSVAIGILNNTDSRSSLDKQQFSSACMRNPSSPYPAACTSRLQPGIYSSVPNGILENIDLRSNLMPVGGVLQRKSLSDIFSFPCNQSGLDYRKPFLSPVKMGSEIITSRSGGSEKVTSGNPELTCFTIMEDPENSEEDVDEAKTGLEGPVINMKSSSIEDPLCNITEKNNTSLVPDNAVEKRFIKSLSKEFGDSEISDVNSQVNDMSHRQSKRITQGKENKGFSIGGNSCSKKTKALSSRFSKPKLSSRSSLRIRGQSMSEKEPKRNNIVSNVKSFVPLVQQKQAAAAAPVKRDIKVKALEAAEAAKRLAEKKEDERRQKKEALKNERARLEQENLKQMELAKKLKAEAKRKREAENAAKKRQRAEEENKERERKRKRVEDARCEQKKAQEKILAWREESRYGAQDEKTLEGEELNKKERKEINGEIEASISIKPANELVDGGSVKNDGSDGIPTLSNNTFTEPSLIGKVDSVVTVENSTPLLNKGDKPIGQNSEEQSYDISPYQCSDDEEEEDDEMPNKKFIPSWASKNSVSLALSSLQHIDPDTIFPPGSFCSLDEVLLPRRLPQDPRK